MKVVLEHLTKIFPSRNKKSNEQVIAVNDFTFEIPDGKLIGLLGPSGCGKSTTLYMICGLQKPTGGKIFFGEDDVTELTPENRGVGLVFQNYALYPHMTVKQNILFPLQNLKGEDKLSKADMLERAYQAARLVQIDELMDRKPNELSGGQQQRVAIARALVNNPKVLLLDEPLGALDYQLRKNLQLELKNLQRGLGLTFIYVTHDQEEALTMSDRIVVMNKGVIEQDDNPDTIYHTPKSKFVAKFIGESNFFEHEDGSTSVVRPEKLNLCPEDEENATHPEPQLYGTVVDVVFYGTIDKVFVRLDNSNQMVAAYQYFDDVKRWQPDERVGIWWQPQDEVIVHK